MGRIELNQIIEVLRSECELLAKSSHSFKDGRI